MERLKEFLKENYERLMNTPGSENDVAIGFAIGVLVSFTPLIGLHTVLTIVIAYVLGRSVGAGIIGTLIFNPLTWAMIATANITVGKMLLGKTKPHTVRIEEGLGGFARLWEAGSHIFYPYLLGGLVLGTIAAVVGFVLTKRSLITYRKQVYERRKRKREAKVVKNESNATHTA